MTQFMKQGLAVLCGGALGAVCRAEGNRAFMTAVGGEFPLGILCINMLGAFCMGVLLGGIARMKSDGGLYNAFLGTGVLGGFTTFSSFALDTMHLYESGHLIFALLNVGLNTVLCVGLAGLGWTMTAPREFREGRR